MKLLIRGFTTEPNQKVKRFIVDSPFSYQELKDRKGDSIIDEWITNIVDAYQPFLNSLHYKATIEWMSDDNVIVDIN